MPGYPSRSPIVLDVSDVAVVVTCRQHPWWTAMRWTYDEALDVAVRHEHDAHPGDILMQRKRRGRRARTRRDTPGTTGDAAVSGRTPSRIGDR